MQVEMNLVQNLPSSEVELAHPLVYANKPHSAFTFTAPPASDYDNPINVCVMAPVGSPEADNLVYIIQQNAEASEAGQECPLTVQVSGIAIIPNIYKLNTASPRHEVYQDAFANLSVATEHGADTEVADLYLLAGSVTTGMPSATPIYSVNIPAADVRRHEGVNDAGETYNQYNISVHQQNPDHYKTPAPIIGKFMDREDAELVNEAIESDADGKEGDTFLNCAIQGLLGYYTKKNGDNAFRIFVSNFYPGSVREAGTTGGGGLSRQTSTTLRDTDEATPEAQEVQNHRQELMASSKSKLDRIASAAKGDF